MAAQLFLAGFSGDAKQTNRRKFYDTTFFYEEGYDV